MTNEEKAKAYQLAQAQRILDLFQAKTGRAAKSMDELTKWATSPEGEAALAINRDPETGKIDPYN
ncbi:MAG TPA: hypothetical protein VN857_00670 [Chthoniobacterales bacterium]|jgi:hypothetical protein|nr:hypothetical protein [Chthoniobacterales bacterium]